MEQALKRNNNPTKEEIFDWIYKSIDKYGLSLVSKNGYDFYNCESSKGLGEYNKAGYNKLRDDFNSYYWK